MSRRLAREVVLQSLFQIDFNECEADSALNSALAEHDEFACLNEVQEGEEVSAKAVSCMKAKDYAEKVLNGVLENIQTIDDKLSQYAVDWTVERMPATDRNILRIAVYEMLFAEEKIAPGVAINEAVEIAKLYGSEEAPRFINGVLGKMVR
ncbi:MAG: transcription antitermination factor NusB [Phascolarctobacterium sp.]|nr:transcription antitermination factor NusB [Phascolarctobacterium sp.]